TTEYTRAGSFTPNSSGNLVNAAGLYLMGYQMDSKGVAGTTMVPVNTSSLSGSASASTSISMQANLQSTSTVDSTYTAGDMAAGNATPDFSRTINVYDSQGGTEPVNFSFIKT